MRKSDLRLGMLTLTHQLTIKVKIREPQLISYALNL